MNTPNDHDAREQLRVMVSAIGQLLAAVSPVLLDGRIWKTAATLRAADDVAHLVAVFTSITSPASTGATSSSWATSG